MEIPAVSLVICSVIGLFSGVGGGWLFGSWYARRSREHRLPFMLSHQDLLDSPANAATGFLAAVHDMTMAVHEAYNIKQSRHRDPGTIESNIDQAGLLADCGAVEANAAALMRSLAPQAAAAASLQAAADALSKAWSHEQKDNYIATSKTVARSNFNRHERRHIETSSEYSDSDHWFRFDRDAYHQLTYELALLPELAAAGFEVPSIRDKRVRLDQLDPADREFLQRIQANISGDGAHGVHADEALNEGVNQWLAGSDLQDALSEFGAGIEQLLAVAPAQLAAMDSSEPESHEKTFSKYAEGPPGFVAKRQLAGGIEPVLAAWGRVQNTVDHCRTAAQTLRNWASDASIIEPDMDYLVQAIQTYRMTFPRSTVEIDPPEPAGGATLFGLATGSALGAAAFALGLAVALLVG